MNVVKINLFYCWYIQNKIKKIRIFFIYWCMYDINFREKKTKYITLHFFGTSFWARFLKKKCILLYNQGFNRFLFMKYEKKKVLKTFSLFFVIWCIYELHFNELHGRSIYIVRIVIILRNRKNIARNLFKSQKKKKTNPPSCIDIRKIEINH